MKEGPDKKPTRKILRTKLEELRAECRRRTLEMPAPVRERLVSETTESGAINQAYTEDEELVVDIELDEGWK